MSRTLLHALRRHSDAHLLAAALVAASGACRAEDPPGPAAPQKPAPVSQPAPQASVECLGRRLPIKMASNMPYTVVTFTDGASFQGDFVLDLGSNASFIDPGAFASPGPVLQGCNAEIPCSFTAGEVLGKRESPRFLPKDYKDLNYGIRQAGMIGTDFTSESVVTLHYSESSVFVSDKDKFCSDDQLKARGLASMSTEGYYSNLFDKLKLATEVSALPPVHPDDKVVNIPAPMIRLAGLTLPAQLDTGFDDRVEAYSVNVNTAWLRAVQGAQPDLLEIAVEVPLATCVSGISEKSVKYKRRDGKPIELEMLGSSGEALRTFAAVVFVKDTPPEALQCGGIGTWKIPAAQIGASYFKTLDIVVFDPFTSRIWVPRGPTP